VDDIITIIKSAILLISAVFVILAAIGIIRYKDDMERVLYARIHILGVLDVVCMISLLVLGEPLLAGVYFILTPFAAHAIANAHYYGEDKDD